MTTKAMEKFGLPAGRYPATVKSVDLVPPERRRPWTLRVIATVAKNGADVIAFRDLAKDGDDPFDIPKGPRRTLREWAERLGTQASGPVEEIVAGLQGLAGAPVTARVRGTRMGMSVVLYARNGDTPADHTEKAVAGEVLDAVPSGPEPELRDRTIAAQGAHEQLLTGLHHAHRGLALVAEACWKLRQDEGWGALGYDSVSAYLASPEVAMSRSQFYALADIWEQYVVEGGQPQERLCAPSKLEVPLPALKAGDVSAEEALADAESLGLRDLRIKYRDEEDPTGKQKDDGDPPESIDFPFACKACGVVIYGESGVASVDDGDAGAIE